MNTGIYITRQQLYDFKNWFTANIYGSDYQLSDIAKWHSKIITIVNPTNSAEWILDSSPGKQKLGDGWIDIPASHI